MISKDLSISNALRAKKERGILLNPYRFGASPPTYATWNPSDKGSGGVFAAVLSNGNLTLVGGSNYGWARSTVGVSSGKWYWEFTSTGTRYAGVGVAKAGAGAYPGSDANGWGWLGLQVKKVNNGVQTAWGTGWTSGQVVGIALDMSAGTVEFYKAGSSMGGVAFSGIAGTVFAQAGGDTDSATSNTTANFGATAFAFTPPAGYNAGLYS